MIQSFPQRRMAVPMAERLTMVRLCLRPAPASTRRHFCPTATPVRILRHLSSGLKSRRARQRGTSLTFIIYDRYFSQARAHTFGSERARSVRADVVLRDRRLREITEVRLENRPIYRINSSTLGISNYRSFILTSFVTFLHIV